MKHIFFTLLMSVLSVICSFGQSIPAYVPTAGLVAWWPFNGNANDKGPSANNGVVYGASLTTDRLGNANSAYSFNGISDYIMMTNSNIPVNIYNGLTISFWFKAPAETDTTMRRFILSKYNGYGLQIELTSKYINRPLGSLRTSLRQNGGANPESNIFSQKRYDDDIWHFGVMSWKAPRMLLYVDGNLISTDSTLNTNFDAPGEVLRFGCLNSSWFYPARNFFKGKLDDIGMWSRALTESEIKVLYADGKLISSQPMSQTVRVGDDGKFSIQNDTTLKYQWQSNACNLGWQNVIDNSTYAGGNTNELIVKGVQVSNHNQKFRVVVSNSICADTSKVATLVVSDTCLISEAVSDTLVINLKISGINSPFEANIIKVYPNPAKENLMIDFGDYLSMSGYALNIKNSLGQTVYTSLVDKKVMNIALSGWSGKGLYIVEIINTQNQVVSTKKIVLE